MKEVPKTMSWLVRFWEEPREHPQEASVVRCFIRDLRTGEERYVNDPRELGELMLQRLRAVREGADETEQNGSLTGG